MEEGNEEEEEEEPAMVVVVVVVDTGAEFVLVSDEGVVAEGAGLELFLSNITL